MGDLPPYNAAMIYGVVGKFSTHPGKRDQLVGHLLEAAKLLERNPQCIYYVVGITGEPEEVWVWEAWTDKSSHGASLEAEDVRRLIQDARPLVAAISHHTELAIKGGKGMSR
jgi:quinol monooxygenase YgiN